MNVAAQKLHLLKIDCFAHALNLGAQSVYTVSSVAKWPSKIRDVVVWMKRSTMAKTVLREKQQILNLPQHSLLLDVRTRWNSLYFMLERFLEQYPAVQAASLDQRLRKPMERDRLARVTDEDIRKAEDFVNLMQVMYTSTLCVSTEKSPTCGQIIPILQKLEAHFTVQEGDTVFVSTLKTTVWSNLSQRYQLTEHGYSEEGMGTSQQHEDEEASEESKDEMTSAVLQKCKKAKMTPLEELFAEDEAHKQNQIQSTLSIQEKSYKELEMYREVLPLLTSQDPALWWWSMKETYTHLSDLALSYLCAQASSTPSERVFSTAGDTVS